MEPDKLQVYPDAAAVAEAAAGYIVRHVQRAVEARGQAVIALAGGSTPRPTYRRLSQPPWSSAMPWSHVHIFWGDERCVPPDDPESNYRMVHETLLSGVSLPKENIHSVPTDLAPEEAAEAYRRELKTVLGEPPRFDLVLLGMGRDGHTASLFPGSDALDIEGLYRDRSPR